MCNFLSLHVISTVYSLVPSNTKHKVSHLNSISEEYNAILCELIHILNSYTLPSIKDRVYKISQPGKHMTFHNMIIYDINSNGTFPSIKERVYKISQPGKHITFHNMIIYYINSNGTLRGIKDRA